jgi:PAS domain S-box-containing protein
MSMTIETGGGARVLRDEDRALELPGRLFDSLPAAMYICDRDGLVLRYNRRAAELWGRSPRLGDPSERFCGSYRMYRLDGGPLAHPECPMADVLRTGIAVHNQEIVIERPDGSRGIALVNIDALRDTNGNVIGAVNCFQDVTERKRADETLRRAEQELRDFVENASVGMHWIGPDGTIIWANRTELEMLGFTAEEYIGKRIADFHVDQPVIEDILDRLARGETLKNQDARMRCKDGSIREVLINSNVLWEGDKFVHTRCFTRDITERKLAEEHVRILAHEIDHRAKNLLAVVQATVHLTQAETAHDLKTAIEGRIRAIANAHTLLTQSRWTGADLRRLIMEELLPYCPDGTSRADISGPKLILEPQSAQSIAIVLHELTTNAAKYGALSVPAGRVRIEWSRATNGKLVLRWSETDGPPVTAPRRQGFGTRVVDQIIRAELKGEAHYDWRPKGLVCEIAIQA